MGLARTSLWARDRPSRAPSLTPVSGRRKGLAGEAIAQLFHFRMVHG
jgi:hypothetical protein